MATIIVPENSITFMVDGVDYNTLTDFGLIMGECQFGAAPPNIIGFEIPFRNGTLDITDYYGELTYKNRTISTQFYIPYGDDYENIHSQFCLRIHGKKCNIHLSHKPEWYYKGRCIVGNLQMSEIDGYWGFTLSMSVEPFKYKFIEQICENVDNTHKDFNFPMDAMPVIPSFSEGNSNVLSHRIGVIIRNTTFYVEAGESYNPDIVLTYDKHNIKLFYTQTGITGNIKVSYEEGKL